MADDRTRPDLDDATVEALGKLVEDFDARYWSAFRTLEERARADLAGGDRQVYEARMKQREHTRGHPGHRPGPALTDHDSGREPGTLVP